MILAFVPELFEKEMILDQLKLLEVVEQLCEVGQLVCLHFSLQAEASLAFSQFLPSKHFLHWPMTIIDRFFYLSSLSQWLLCSLLCLVSLSLNSLEQLKLESFRQQFVDHCNLYLSSH